MLFLRHSWPPNSAGSKSSQFIVCSTMDFDVDLDWVQTDDGSNTGLMTTREDVLCSRQCFLLLLVITPSLSSGHSS